MPWRFYVLIGAITVSFGSGWILSNKLFQAKLNAMTISAQEQALESSKALAIAEQIRQELSYQLEDAANAQPVTSSACLPIERVRRLNLR